MWRPKEGWEDRKKGWFRRKSKKEIVEEITQQQEVFSKHIEKFKKELEAKSKSKG